MGRKISYRFLTLLIGIMVAIFIGYAIWLKPLTPTTEPTQKLNSITRSPIEIFRTVVVQTIE